MLKWLVQNECHICADLNGVMYEYAQWGLLSLLTHFLVNLDAPTVWWNDNFMHYCLLASVILLYVLLKLAVLPDKFITRIIHDFLLRLFAFSSAVLFYSLLLSSWYSHGSKRGLYNYVCSILFLVLAGVRKSICSILPYYSRSYITFINQ